MQTAIESIRGNFIGGIDCTLREGWQFAGRASVSDSGATEFYPAEFTKQQGVRILGYLHAINMEWAELPNPLAPGMTDFNRQMSALRERPRLTTHIRNNKRDLAAAQECGIDGVSILYTVDEERIAGMGLTSDQYRRRLIEIVTEAQDAGLVTRVSVEHSWNVAMHAMMDIYTLADSMKVDRVGLADTLGTATRWQVAERVSAVKNKLRHAKIEGHFHNDTGEALSNTLSGLEYGISWPNATFGGFGERSGITPWSSLMVRLYTMDPLIVKRYSLSYLTQAERDVAAMIGVDLPFNLPTSPQAFANRSGIHVNEIVNGRHDLYVPYNPAIIGNSPDIIVGTAISGRTTHEQREHYLNLRTLDNF